MKIIKQSVDITTPTMITDPVRHIERCARICYKSEDKITADSARKFVPALVKRGHLSPIEHYRWAAEVPEDVFQSLSAVHPRHLVLTDRPSIARYVVSGSARGFAEIATAGRSGMSQRLEWAGYAAEFIISAIVDKYDCAALFGDTYTGKRAPKIRVLPPDLDGLTPYEQHQHGWYTVRYITDRGISHELVRHRLASFSQESTRYCKYNGSDICFISPLEGSEMDGKLRGLTADEAHALVEEWRIACRSAEEHYDRLIALGAPAQFARAVLPTSVKTELVMTTTLADKHHFFELRCSPGAHPTMRTLAKQELRQAIHAFPGHFEDIWDMYYHGEELY